MISLAHDLRIGCRRLWRSPLAAAAAITTLALGIGAATAIFSVVDTVLLRPLPYAEPEELVTLWETHRHQGAGGKVASFPATELWRSELDDLSGVAVSRSWRPVLARGGDLLSLEGAKVSADFFAVLGVEPSIGRGFKAADARPGAPPVVIVSHRLWRRHFGGDERLVGSGILLEGAPDQVRATVAGVLPPRVRVDPPLVYETAEIFAPLSRQDASDHFGQRYFKAVGRLASDARIETASSRLEALAARLAEARPRTNDGWSAALERLDEQLTEPLRPALTTLGIGVTLVFLVACCNVGILLTSQASVRRRELAVRLALGAGGWRVGRQVLTECLLLALGGAALGLWLAHYCLPLVSGYVTTLTPFREVAIDGRAFLFTFGLALLTVLLLGAVPAIRTARLDPRSTLAGLAKPNTAGDGPRRFLIAIELALSSMLLVTASMLIDNFRQLAAADPGFAPQGVMTMRLRSVGSDAAEGPSTARREPLYRRLREEAAQLPGVQAAGLISQPPLSSASMSCDAAPLRRSEDRSRVELRGVTSQTFEALGIPVIERGDLGRLDDRSLNGVVVSESAARLLWPGTEALGRRLTLDWGHGQSREVLGVAGDLRHPMAPAEVRPTVYLPFNQVPHRAITLVLLAHGHADPFAAVRARARALGSPLVVDRPKELPQAVDATIAEPRARTLLVGAFALSALLLAAVGTYSVVALAVEQSGYASSVRLALGAHPRRLVRETMAEILKPASWGIASGLAGSLLLARGLSGLLYGVEMRDPRSLLGAAAITALVVVIASYLPAHRLSTTDPAMALRAE